MSYRPGPAAPDGVARRRWAAELVDEILDAPQLRESDLRTQRIRVAELAAPARASWTDRGQTDLRSVIDHLIRRSVWIVGGDGWAYDIGSGGLDHVLASGHNVNVLVLDTEVYSNTGGQMSKATPLGAVAKFAAARQDDADQGPGPAGHRPRPMCTSLGSPWAQTPSRRSRAFREAEAYDGPSLIIAYCHCIAHGYRHERRAWTSSTAPWPAATGRSSATTRSLRAAGRNPFLLDSPRPRMTLAAYRQRELRFRALADADPAEAERLLALAQQTVELRWQTYEDMAAGRRALLAGRPQGRVMDLATNYMGLRLSNPLVASASPLSYTLDGVRRLADGGVGAIVLFSLFEEQLREQACTHRPARGRPSRELRRGPRLFPGRGGRRPRTPPVPESA